MTHYKLQCNNCGLVCEGPEDIETEKSEDLRFSRPHSHLMPPLQ